MSEVSQGLGWWQASDGKWYAPELHLDDQASAPVDHPVVSSPTIGSDQVFLAADSAPVFAPADSAAPAFPAVGSDPVFATPDHRLCDCALPGDLRAF